MSLSSLFPAGCRWLRRPVLPLGGLPLALPLLLCSPMPPATYPLLSLAAGAAAAPAPQPPQGKPSGGKPPGGKPTAPEARAAAEAWLERFARRPLAMRASLAADPFVLRSSDTPGGRVSQFTLQGSGWWLSLAFRGELAANTPLAEVRRRFWFATLERMPTPGLELPGWEIRPLTPVSSIEEGVEILGYGRGRMQVRLRTRLFALWGRDPAILIPADAAAPPSAFFQISTPLALDLTVAAPLRFP